MSDLAAWVCLVAFGSIALLVAFQFVWPPVLVVSEAGIEQRGVWAQPFVPWSDIAEFVELQQSTSWSSVTHLGYRFTPLALRDHRGGWHKLFSFGRYDRWIMSGSSKRSAAVLELLLQRHREALSNAS